MVRLFHWFELSPTVMSKELVERVALTIKRLRKDKGISQEELAARANLDRTYISGIERGVRNITLDSLESLITALDISIDVFLDELKKQNIK